MKNYCCTLLQYLLRWPRGVKPHAVNRRDKAAAASAESRSVRGKADLSRGKVDRSRGKAIGLGEKRSVSRAKRRSVQGKSRSAEWKAASGEIVAVMDKRDEILNRGRKINDG